MRFFAVVGAFSFDVALFRFSPSFVMKESALLRADYLKKKVFRFYHNLAAVKIASRPNQAPKRAMYALHISCAATHIRKFILNLVARLFLVKQSTEIEYSIIVTEIPEQFFWRGFYANKPRDTALLHFIVIIYSYKRTNGCSEFSIRILIDPHGYFI